MSDKYYYRRLITQILIVLAVLGGAVWGAWTMIQNKKMPDMKPAQKNVPLVELIQVSSVEVPIEVVSTGTVRAKNTAQVVSQVAGKVLSSSLLEGAYFKADQQLVKIDAKDYELAVETALAEVESAKVKLEQEQAEADVARKEWDELNPDKTPDSPLVLREPQIKEAKAKLQSAKARLDIAKLDLERTSISLPFDGRIVEDNIDVGQYVNKGQSLGSVYGTQAVEIRVPLEDKELEWFEVAGSVNSPVENEAVADVIANFAGKRYVWQGKVVRTAGQIDARTRMVHVIVEVASPFGVKDKPPLVPGMFVTIVIKGKSLKNCYKIPRGAVHEGDKLWLLKEGKLKIVEVETARKDRDFAYIVDGLEEGAMVVTSSIDMVVDGMKVESVK